MTRMMTVVTVGGCGGLFAVTISVKLHTHVGYTPLPSGQLSLLPSVGWEMSTGQSAVTLCGWGVKAGMVYSSCE